jgi:hypothetical protein
MLPEPLEARASVACIVARGDIGARDCVERQGSMKCFCPRAVFAINAMSPLVVHGSKLAEALDRCRSVAQAVLHKPELADRHLGPARAAFDGRPAAASLFPGPLPVPTPRRVRAKVPTIDEPPEEEAEPVKPRVVPAIEPAEEPARNLCQERHTFGEDLGTGREHRCSLPADGHTRHLTDEPTARWWEVHPVPPAAPRPPTPPAEPAQEKTMAPKSKMKDLGDTEVKALFAKHGSVKSLAEAVGCTWKTAKQRVEALGLLKGDAEEPKPEPAAAEEPATVPTSGQVKPIAPPAGADPVVQLLRSELAKAERQAERLRAALTALEAA